MKWFWQKPAPPIEPFTPIEQLKRSAISADGHVTSIELEMMLRRLSRSVAELTSDSGDTLRDLRHARDELAAVLPTLTEARMQLERAGAVARQIRPSPLLVEDETLKL